MRVAVFVDAGYVFAQGSKLLSDSGNKIARGNLEIDAKKIVARLTNFAATKSSNKELLRIYWYDGAPISGTLPAQDQFAEMDNVKLRLGQLNSANQQKGVDSLIVIDLTELARNNAISDAVVFAGDEDIRIAVQLAQSHGVRVHLLGIRGVAKNDNQSPSLQKESDTVSIWHKSEVASFLKQVAEPKAPPEKKTQAK
ncbi:MAG: NYN domain-containing protein [Aestuariivirga sp.]